MANASGCYSQNIFSWTHCKLAPPWIACAPHCSWKVDEHGFSVEDVAHGSPLQFVVAWIGPSICPTSLNQGFGLYGNELRYWGLVAVAGMGTCGKTNHSGTSLVFTYSVEVETDLNKFSHLCYLVNKWHLADPCYSSLMCRVSTQKPYC